MKINVIIIDKKGKDNLYAGLIEHYKKISKLVKTRENVIKMEKWVKNDRKYSKYKLFLIVLFQNIIKHL